MGIYRGTQFDPTGFSTATGANLQRAIAGGIQGFAFRFTGDGKKYRGVRCHIGATAGGLGSGLKMKFGVQKDDGSLPYGTPSGTYIGYAHTTRTWDNASVKSWMTFTFGTPSGWIATAGNKYWLRGDPVSFVNGDQIRISWFSGYTRRVFVHPDSTVDPAYVFKTYQSGGGIWNATAQRIPSVYLVSTPSPSTYMGCPYHQINARSFSYGTPEGVHFRLTTSCVLSSVAVRFAHNSVRDVIHYSLYTGTSNVYNSSNLLWEATENPNVGTGIIWRGFNGRTTALPYGYYTFVASARGTQPRTLHTLVSDNTMGGTDNRLGTSYAWFSKDVRSATADGIFYFHFNSAFSTFQGRVRDWYFNTVQPNITLKYYYGNTVVGTHLTGSTGWSKFSSVAPDRVSKFVPSYGTWNFSTPYWASARMTTNATAHFVKGPDTQWPNLASPYAFRELLLLSSAHTAIPKGYLINCNIRTGASRRAGTNGHFNESFGTGGGTGIAYYDNKTHIVWRGEQGRHYGRSFNQINKTWGSQVFLSTVYSAIAVDDSHYGAHIDVDHSGYLHYIYLTHGGEFALPLYYMFQTANSLSSKKVHTASIGEGTYHSMCNTTKNTLYAFTRIITGDSLFGYDMKRQCHTARAWTGLHTVAVSTQYAGKFLSWYFNGPYVDANDTIHISLTMDENYGDGGIQYNTHMFYLYSPPSYVSASTTEPGHYWYAANGSVVAILTQNTVNPMRFRSATSNAAIIATCASNWYTKHGVSFSSNIKNGIFAHPRQSYSAGGRTNLRPYHTFNVDSSPDPNGCLANIAWYDPSASNKNIHNWVIRNLTTAVASFYGSSVRPWNHRCFGPMLIDHKNTIRAYGTIRKGEAVASALWGGEIFEWSSEDNGANWKGKFLTERSSWGVPLLEAKRNMENQLVELAYSRGRDIHYYADSSVFPKFRDSGSDIAIVFSGTPTPKAVDSVADYYNFSTSQVTFALHTTIPKNCPCSTAGQYYIYYGQAVATPLAANPLNTYLLYENFEQYPTPSTSWFAPTYNRNGWSYQFNATYPITKSAWRVTGSFQNDPIWTLKSLQHTGNLWGGDRYLFSWAGTAGTGAVLVTCYAFTAVPVRHRRGVAAECSIRYHLTQDNSMIGFAVGSTHTIVGVKKRENQWSYYTGNVWRHTSATAVGGDVKPGLDRYNRFKIQLVGTAFTCYVNNSSTAIGYLNLPWQCSAQRFIVGAANYGNTNRSTNSTWNNFIDYIIMYPAYPETYVT